MPELRRDPITGRQVIIAPQRAARPRHLEALTSAAPVEHCPFCPGNELMTPPEVWADRDHASQVDAPGWRVRVFPNKYPALQDHPEGDIERAGLFRSSAAFGAHEVIIESPTHDVHMSGLSSAQFHNIVRAYRARWRALAADARWRYLLIYKNQGERAGATLEHVHSQLIALPSVPRESADERDGARAWFGRAGRCIYCDIMERERMTGERLVWESERFIALCPFAPRFAYETWILPRKHTADFAAISDEDVDGLAEMLRTFIARLDAIADGAPFNYLLHSAPLRETVGEFYHWHLEILPQLHRAAGFEWGSGMHMNPVAPEEAARLLRDAPR